MNATAEHDSIANRAADVTLSNPEIQRYARHLIMPEVALEGQKRLKAARVLCIGAGGLGSPTALYLAAAGVGTIGLVDFDVVDVSNLQRQILHATPDVGRPKLQSAADKLRALNPDLNLILHETHITRDNALDLVRPYDIVVDGTDNFATRYLVNDACVLLGKPNVYGSIFRFDGQASVFAAQDGPCYRCLYPEPPPPDLVPSCAEGGVLGILPGFIGVVQATETVKLILGKGRSLVGRLLLYDALDMTVREMKVRKNPKCPICGPNPTITELIDYEQFCNVRGAEPEPAVHAPTPGASEMPAVPASMTPLELKAMLDRGEKPFVLDVRNPEEIVICRLDCSVVIPLPELPARVGELNPDVPIVVHCKSGARSQKAIALLKQHGFTQLTNLHGGILGWIKDVDPSLPSY
ncbi:MAG: molybdopterin-synthase adenylyltransferase MoeB [Planctomycetota bacterium]|nr:molybdopterin-synthase adenylyltransferase MoeB [Planctomycetota bacterium]